MGAEHHQAGSTEDFLPMETESISPCMSSALPSQFFFLYHPSQPSLLYSWPETRPSFRGSSTQQRRMIGSNLLSFQVQRELQLTLLTLNTDCSSLSSLVHQDLTPLEQLLPCCSQFVSCGPDTCS